MQKKDIIGSEAGSPLRVGIFPIDGFALMSYACTVEPLRAANLMSTRPLYEVVNYGPCVQAKSSSGALIECVPISSGTASLDLLLVIAGGDPFSFRDLAAFGWIAQLARRGVRMGGVSGGPVILANAGLMAGRRMAVHWEHVALLEERFDDLLVERRLFVIDRDRVTCGGGIAPLDLMHSLIAEEHGSVFARLVSDWFLHTHVRAATSPQRGQVSERVAVNSPHVEETIEAMESHIADPLSLSQLALFAGVSTRHLNRLFVRTLGASVMDHYRALRLAAAQRMVRSSQMRFDEIAHATGFANAGHFSNAYQSEFGLRPRSDRNTIQIHSAQR